MSALIGHGYGENRTGDQAFAPGLVIIRYRIFTYVVALSVDVLDQVAQESHLKSRWNRATVLLL